MQKMQIPYTPTTEEIRADYCLLADVSRPRQMQFDRWLAEVKAEAWQEGALTEWTGFARDKDIISANPYRQEEEQ